MKIKVGERFVKYGNGRFILVNYIELKIFKICLLYRDVKFKEYLF